MSAAIDRLREQLACEGPTNLVLVVRTADLREVLDAIESAERVCFAAKCAAAIDALRPVGGVGTVATADDYVRGVALDDAQRAVMKLSDATPATPDGIDPAAGEALR